MEDTKPTDINFSNSSSDFEESLRRVELRDDNITMLINGEPGYPVALPKYISAKRKREDKTRIVEKKIYGGCYMYNINYVSEDNVRNHTNEIVNLLFQRANVAAAAAAANAVEEKEDEEEQQQPTIELTQELTREISLEEVADILSTSIKKDNPAKLITFCAMLLAQTNNDQLNLGFQAESSAGKSYVPLEVSIYFPEQEIEIIASASPTAFYHDGGVWDDSQKAIIKDLAHKNLIFLDMPHFQLLEKLRPMASHDRKELRYMITDKSQKHGLRTKNVILRGYPCFYFCTTKIDPDEQEKTRMIMLSPETDQEKLMQSLELAALRKGNPEEYQRRIMEDPKRSWLTQRIYAIRQGGIREIILPDNGIQLVLDRFKREHPHLQARHQRDFPRIFSFIKAHALLNCFNRQKNNEKADTIVATEPDIDAGFKLYREIEQSNELGLSPYIYRIYEEVIAPLLQESYDKGDGEGVTNQDILKRYYAIRHKTLSPATLKNVLLQLETVGLIRLEQDKKDRRYTVVYPTVSLYISQGQEAGGECRYIQSDSGVTTTTTTIPQQQEKLRETGGD